MTLLKVFFIIAIAYFVLRASRNLMLAAQGDPKKLSNRDAAGAATDGEDDERLPRYRAPHEVVEDARWEDL